MKVLWGREFDIRRKVCIDIEGNLRQSQERPVGIDAEPEEVVFRMPGHIFLTFPIHDVIVPSDGLHEIFGFDEVEVQMCEIVHRRVRLEVPVRGAAGKQIVDGGSGEGSNSVYTC